MRDDETWIEVTAGPELYSPVAYNTFTVGPMSVRRKLREGETVEEAYESTLAFLRVQMKREYVAKRDAFLANYSGVKKRD